MRLHIVGTALVLAGLGYWFYKETNETERGIAMLRLESTSFAHNELIPQKYTCHGVNVSPELHWSTDAKNIGSYVLIVDDPDAKRVIGRTFVHWIAYLPSYIVALPEGASGNGSNLKQLISAAQEGLNDSGKTEFGGPCPPASSGEHTYRFTLYAVAHTLDEIMSMRTLRAPFTAEQFESAMASSIMGQARLIGRFQAPKN